MLYPLNLYSALCQLYNNRTGGKYLWNAGILNLCIIFHLNSIMVFWLCYFFFVVLWPHLWHLEVPRLGDELELQLLDYATATAVLNPSHVCYLHHSPQQPWIFNQLRETRDGTCVLMDTSQICFCWDMMGNPDYAILDYFLL